MSPDPPSTADPAEAITLDGLNVFRAAVKAMPYEAKLELLKDGLSRQTHPAWLTALREDNFFSQPLQMAIYSGSIRSTGHFMDSTMTLDQHHLEGLCGVNSRLSCLLAGEHPVYAALVRNLTTPRKKTPADFEKNDPHTGDKLNFEQSFRNDTNWSPSVRADFRAIVDDFLSQSKEAPRNLKVNDRAFFPVQASLLLCAACAGGDVPSVLALMKSYPNAVHTLVSNELLHLDGVSPLLEVTPALLAVEFDQRPVLDALKAEGWDPMGTLAGKLKDQSHRVHEDKTFPKKFGMAGYTPKGLTFFDLAKNDDLSSSSAFTAHSWRPHVTDLFFEAYMAKADAPALCRMGDVVESVVSEAINEFPGSALRASIIRTGVAARFPVNSLTAAAGTGDVEMLQTLRHAIDWSEHVGRNLPFIQEQYNDANRKSCLLLVQWCIEDGRKDLLLAPGFLCLEDASNVSPAHHFASRGFTEALHVLLEHGLDPMMEDMISGRTVIRCAEDSAEVPAATLLRSHMAKKAMHAALDSMADASKLEGAPP